MKTTNSNQIVLTGIRPTSNLTIANYIGAIMPILAFQEEGLRPYVFVADIHALTDNEPEVLKYGDEILIDLLAAGVDPVKTIVYKQSSIANEIGVLTLLLARHVSVTELLRLPTLKEKVKSDNVENANALLLMYPVMMAADILVQRATTIPVGKDQTAHIEIARKIARRFNKEVGDIFPEPVTHVMDMVKILSLRGESKMSKSIPEDAIFLTDTPDKVKVKIKRAQTAIAGVMSDNLESHITLIKAICDDAKVLEDVDSIINAHMNGQSVMGDFKKIFTEVVINFLSSFQSKRKEIITNKEKYLSYIQLSSNIAIFNAKETMKMVYDALKL
ncbi:MAG: tryptophan--tRNA ligase [Candidatus Paceibacterota bacterium]